MFFREAKNVGSCTLARAKMRSIKWEEEREEGSVVQSTRCAHATGGIRLRRRGEIALLVRALVVKLVTDVRVEVERGVAELLDLKRMLLFGTRRD